MLDKSGVFFAADDFYFAAGRIVAYPAGNALDDFIQHGGDIVAIDVIAKVFHGLHLLFGWFVFFCEYSIAHKNELVNRIIYMFNM